MGRRRLYAARFTDPRGPEAEWIIPVVREDDGTWRVEGGAGGSGRMRATPDAPRANLGGGGWPAAFYAGGVVLDAEGSVARVRLTAANGTVVEDTVDDGRVLFITNRLVELPIEAQLLDQSGTIVARHGVFHQ